MQAAQLQVQELQAATKALKAEFELARQQAVDQLSYLETHVAELKGQLQRAETQRQLQVCFGTLRMEFIASSCYVGDFVGDFVGDWAHAHVSINSVLDWSWQFRLLVMISKQHFYMSFNIWLESHHESCVICC